MEHTWDQKYHDEKKKRREQNSNPTDNNPREELELSFAQLQNACYCCGKKGHSADKCYKRDSIPKEEWYINRLQKQETEKIRKQQQEEQQLLQVNSNTTNTTNSITTSSNNSDSNTSVLEWSGAHIIPNETNLQQLNDTILLDNGSTTSVFCNPRMVTNIREVDNPITLQTNGGIMEVGKKALVPGFGEVWYHPNAMANIFSFAEMKQKHPITYNSNDEDAFHIHLPNKVIKFNRTSNGLYLYKPNNYVLRSMEDCIKEAKIAGVEDNNNHNSIEMNEVQIAGVNEMNSNNGINDKKSKKNKRKKYNKRMNQKSRKHYNNTMSNTNSNGNGNTME